MKRSGIARVKGFSDTVARLLIMLAPALLVFGCASTPPPVSADQTGVRIALVGDIMLGGTATEFVERHGYDYPFEHVRAELARADVVFGNLEGPLTDRGEPLDKRFVFRTPPDKVAPALARAGFDVVALANNHTLDYGPEGLFDTLAALSGAGISGVGAGVDSDAARAPVVVESGGLSIGFLAYSNTFPEAFWATAERPGTAFGHEHHVRADVSRLREQVDVVVVSFHWGQELATELRDYQPRLGRAAIEAGADIVAGHHPHILQGVEVYGGGVIFYSLGNFTFGSYSENARTSAIARVRVGPDGLQAVELTPINVYNPEVLFRPQVLDGAPAQAVIDELQRLSAPLQTVIRAEDGRARVVLPAPRDSERFDDGQDHNRQ